MDTSEYLKMFFAGAAALSLAEAVEAAGPATDPTSALPVFGELNAPVLSLFTPRQKTTLSQPGAPRALKVAA